MKASITARSTWRAIRGSRPSAEATVFDAVEHDVLTFPVDHRHPVRPLEVDDFIDEARALEQNVHELAVDDVEALANLVEVGRLIRCHPGIIAEDSREAAPVPEAAPALEAAPDT